MMIWDIDHFELTKVWETLQIPDGAKLVGPGRRLEEDMEFHFQGDRMVDYFLPIKGFHYN